MGQNSGKLQGDTPVFYARVLTYMITLFTLIGLGLSLFAHEAVNLLTAPSYHGAAGVVPFIVVSYLFYEIYYVVSLGFDLTGKTPYTAFIIGTGAVFNLFLNFVLIPPFGMMEAAVATVLSYILLPIIEYPIAQRLYPVHYEGKRLFKVAFVSVGVYLIGVALKTGQLWVDLGVGTVLILVWGLALYRWRLFTQDELSAARAAMSKGLRMFQVRLQRVVSKMLRAEVQ